MYEINRAGQRILALLLLCMLLAWLLWIFAS